MQLSMKMKLIVSSSMDYTFLFFDFTGFELFVGRNDLSALTSFAKD